jgi:hypothetical protein
VPGACKTVQYAFSWWWSTNKQRRVANSHRDFALDLDHDGASALSNAVSYLHHLLSGPE